jgi:hypothetical protein
MLRELTRPSPRRPLFFLPMAQFREILRHLIFGESHMTGKTPFYESDQPPEDEPKNLQVLSYKPKATFHWPPDCLWPFMDHEVDRDT